MNQKLATKKVFDKTSGECVGIVVGTYNPLFYTEVMFKNLKVTKLWDDKYPEWRRSPLLLVYYDKPRRNMTKQEVADYFSLTVEQISDELYEALTILENYMVQPYDSIAIK